MLSCVVLCCVVVHRVVALLFWVCIVLKGIVLHCLFQRMSLFRWYVHSLFWAFFSVVAWFGTLLYCIVLYWLVLYGFVLYCVFYYVVLCCII